MDSPLLSTFEYILFGMNAGVSTYRFAWDLDPAHSSDANSQIQWYYVLTIPYVINWIVRPYLWYLEYVDNRDKQTAEENEKKEGKSQAEIKRAAKVRGRKTAGIKESIMYFRAQSIAIGLLFILQSSSDIRNPVEGMFPQFAMATGIGLSVSVTTLSMIPFLEGKRLRDVCIRPPPHVSTR